MLFEDVSLYISKHAVDRWRERICRYHDEIEIAALIITARLATAKELKETKKRDKKQYKGAVLMVVDEWKAFLVTQWNNRKCSVVTVFELKSAKANRKLAEAKT